MARIPTGNFGFGTAEARRPVDRSAVIGALEDLGDAAMRREVEQMAKDKAKSEALSQAKASGHYMEEKSQLGQIRRDIENEISTRTLNYEQALSAFDARADGLSAPDYAGLEAATVVNLQNLRKSARLSERADLENTVSRARTGDHVVQLRQNGDHIGVLSRQRGADLQRLLSMSTGVLDNARRGGVDEETVQEESRRVRLALGLAAANQDPVATLAKLVGAQSGDAVIDGLDVAGRDKVAAAAQSRLVDQAVLDVVSAFAGSGTSAGLQAMAVVEKSGLPPGLLDDVRAKVNEQISQVRTQRRSEYAEQLEQVERAIADDSAGRTTRLQVDQLLQVGAYTPMEAASKQGEITRAQQERNKGDAGIAAISPLIAAGIPLDPSNSLQMQGWDAAFKRDTTGSAPGDPQHLAMAKAYAQKGRTLPSSAASWLRSAARSPDKDIAATAARFYGAIALDAPEAIGDMDKDSRAFLASMSSMLDAGATPEAAFQAARENIYSPTPAILERRREAWKYLVKQTDSVLASRIGKDFNAGWFNADPAVGASAQTAFQGQVREYFLKTGDINQAQDMAWSDIKRVYGPTEVNGINQFVALPVERYGLTPADVRTGIEQFLSKNPQDRPISAADVMVRSDLVTARSVADALDGASVRPTYELRYPDGSPLLTAEGARARFQIPAGEELQALVAKHKAADDAKELEKAEEARAVIKALERNSAMAGGL